MKNYIQPGGTVTVVAPAALLSGVGVLVGSLFGVACSDALISASVEIALDGVFTLPKVAGVINQGDMLYWDNTAGNLTKTSAANTLVGFAMESVASGATAINVLIGRHATLAATNLTATASLNFPSLLTMESADLTITVTGASVGDSVAVGAPAAFPVSHQAMGFVSATHTVTVRVSNLSAGTVDLAAATWRATVLK